MNMTAATIPVWVLGRARRTCCCTPHHARPRVPCPQTAATATIWVWCCRTWRAVAQLRAHTLTVTQLAWSPSGRLLAAGSRDRTFSVFRRCDTPSEPGAAAAAAAGDGDGGGVSFKLVHRSKGAHSRIVWSVSWSSDEQLLATASRDQLVKVWSTQGCSARGGSGSAQVPLAAALPAFPAAVTAVAFAPQAVGGGELLAVGLEDGAVSLWRLAVGAEQLEASCVWSAGRAVAHVAAVRRLCWRGARGTGAAEEQEGQRNGDGKVRLQLGSCSDDHSVRVFTFTC